MIQFYSVLLDTKFVNSVQSSRLAAQNATYSSPKEYKLWLQKMFRELYTFIPFRLTFCHNITTNNNNVKD